MARKLLSSRASKIGFVAITLTLVMWLCTSLLLDASIQRQAAEKALESSAQEERLIRLASLISAERDRMYRLLSRLHQHDATQPKLPLSEPNQVQSNRITLIKEEFQQLALEADSLFTQLMEDADQTAMPALQSANGVSAVQGSENDRTDSRSALDNNSVGQATIPHNTSGPNANTTSMEHTSIQQMGDTGHSSTSHGSTGEFPPGSDKNSTIVKLQTLYRSLTGLRDNVIAMADGETRELNANAAMHYFHQYTKLIDAIDSQRRVAQKQWVVNKQEIFLHIQVSNAVWNLIESTRQTVTLLDGVKSSSSGESYQTLSDHSSQMFYSLNMEIDLYLNELLRVNSSMDSGEVSQSISALAQWYPSNYSEASWRAQRLFENGNISGAVLSQWIIAAQELGQRADLIRQKDQEHTLAAVKQIHAKSTAMLVINSLLGTIGLFMAIASLFFFRKVQQQAYRDELTGLHNRRSFRLRLASGMEQSIGQRTSLGLLAIDLDRFKYVNDTMAHENGDQLLQDVATRLRQIVPDKETVARLGADEFCVIHRSDDKDSALELAADIRQSLSAPFYLNGTTINIGCSVGVARFPNDAGTPDSLIKAADIALYRARKTGANQIVSYDREMEKALLRVARMEQDLKTAIEKDQFELYYQPQYNLGSSRVESVEALLRWTHPKRGMVPPDRFIPVAEQSGLMPAIGNWVIHEAIQQAASWYSQSETPLRVAINVSSEQFLCAGFADTVLSCLELNQLPGELLEIELTESVAMCDMKMVVDILERLRSAGIKIALDDFGTGYSSLSYLQDLPLDTLKIDKSFVQKLLTGDDRLESITESIVSLGKSLNLDTVAEGVETCSQLNHVFDMGISVVQGYFYSRPVPADELAQVIVDINKSVPPGEADPLEVAA